MINIYGINLVINDTINPNRVLIQDVPATNGIHIDNISCKVGIDSAGSLSFSIQPDETYYNAFAQMTTFIIVDLGDKNVFYGRVLTVTNGFYGERKITCEGAISLLLDTYYPPKTEKERTPISVYDYLVSVINNHNTQIIDQPEKFFFLSEVPGHYSNAIQNEQRMANEEFSFGTSSWSQTKSILDDLKSHYGGCWRTRYEIDAFSDIGQYGKGNIDLNNRIPVQNEDGSISTEYSFTVNINNEEVLLPMVVNGQLVDENTAIDHYNQTGEYLGKFNNPDEAEFYAIRLHERQDWYYNHVDYYRIYLDWLDQYFNADINTQKIEIGKNLLNIDESTEVDNLFTKIIPIGKSNNKDLYLTGYTVQTINGESWTISGNSIDVPDILKVYSEQELNVGYHLADDYRYAIEDYGVIWKIINFDDMDTQEKLFNAAVKWVRDNYHGSIEKVTVQAIDMHLLSQSVPEISVGDRVYLKFPYGRGPVPPIIERLFTCLEIDYDFYNPENTTYSFGIPSMALTKNYRSSGASTSKKSSSGGYTPPSDDQEAGNEYGTWFDEVRSWLKRHKVWYKHNVPANKQGGPSLIDSSGQSHPPYFWVFDSEMGDDGRGKVLFWSPVITGITNGVIQWGHDNQGRPRGSWLKRQYSEITPKLLENHHIFEYVIYEYGFDLKTQTSTKMPSIIPDEEGGFSIFSGMEDAEGQAGLVSKIIDFVKDKTGIGASVLNIFNSDGLNIAKILTDDGTFLFAELDDEGNVKIDPSTGEPIYINARDIHHSTVDLKADLEELGVTVSLLDSDVTLIGQKVGDETYGLIKTVAEQGQSIASISNDVILLGQNLDSSVASLTADLAATDTTVSALSSDVTLIGQKVGDSTSGLIKDLADLGSTVTSLSSDVTIIGQTVGDETAGLVKDLRDQGQTITVLSSDVTLVKNAVIQKAEISELNALKSRVSTLEADYITADYLVGKHTIAAGNLSAQNFYIDTGTDSEMGSYNLKNAVAYANITENNGLYTLHLYKTTGGEITNPSGYNLTFRKAGGQPNLTWTWSSGTYTVQNNGVDALYTTLRSISPVQNSVVSKSNKWVSRPFEVYYGSDDEHVYSTGFTSTISINATSVYNDGWNECRTATTIPTGSIGDTLAASITVQKPKVDGSSSKDDYTYTLSKNSSFRPSGTSSSIRVVELKYGSTVVARIDANSFYTDGVTAGEASGYTSGQNNVSIGTPSWATTTESNIAVDTNTATFKTTAPTPKSRDLVIVMSKDSSFSSHKLYAYAHQINTNAGNRIARIQIDATSEYTDGQSNGWSGCYGTVGLDNTADLALGYGGSVTVYAQAKASSGASSKTNVAQRKITAPSRPTVSGSWSGGTYTVTGGSNNLTTKIFALTPTGSITVSDKAVKRTYKVQYGTDETHTYDTGFSATVSIDASTVWQNGVDSVTVTSVTTNNASLGANDLRTICSIKGVASNGATKAANFTLARGTYTSGSNSDTRCVVLKEGNTVIGRVSTQADYADGWQNNNSAWIDYGTGSNFQGSLSPKAYIRTFSADINTGNPKYTGGYWYTGKGWLDYVSAPSSHHGDLTAGSYVEVVMLNPSNGVYARTGEIWHVPSGGGSSPSYSVTIDSCGKFSSSSSPTNVLAGWNPKLVSSLPAKEDYYYRYIKFKVDGKQRSFYFSN